MAGPATCSLASAGANAGAALVDAVAGVNAGTDAGAIAGGGAAADVEADAVTGVDSGPDFGSPVADLSAIRRRFALGSGSCDSSCCHSSTVGSTVPDLSRLPSADDVGLAAGLETS